MKTIEKEYSSNGQSRRAPCNMQAPFSWKKILVPTDLSLSSEEAINIAVSLAKQSGAKIILFHVIPLPVCCSFDAPPNADKMMESAQDSLDEIAGTFPPGMNCEKIVRLGTREPVGEILKEASEGSADLIVLGTHGYSGLKRVLLGSTAERLIRHAPCPVLVAPPREDMQSGELQNPFKK